MTFTGEVASQRSLAGYGSYQKSWYERVQPMDLVSIEEYGEIRYVGLVHQKSVRMSMTDRGPERTITISGNSVLALMKSYRILLDMTMLPQQNMSVKSINQEFLKKLHSKSDKGDNLKGIVKAALTKFVDLIDQIGEVKSQAVVALIRKYVDFDSGISPDLESKYPRFFTPFNVGGNSPWDIVEQIVGKPYYEVFGRWDTSKKKWVVVIRKTPFNPEDWSGLRVNNVWPDRLLSYDLNQTDNNVYTMYGSYAPGSNVSRRKALMLDEFNDTMQLDSEKYAMYGYKPLIVSFKFFDRTKAKTDAIHKTLTDINKELHEWYKRNDQYLQGSIEIMTEGIGGWGSDGERTENMPRIGERLWALDGKFYIEAIRRSWKAMGHATTSYTVSRGYKYDDKGNHTGPIDDPAKFPEPGGVT